jgi:hypothetical protein
MTCQPASDCLSDNLVFLGEEPPEPRLVNQVVGEFLIGEKLQGKAARGSNHLEGLLDGEVGLPDDVRNQIHDDLEAADFPALFADLRSLRHAQPLPQTCPTNILYLLTLRLV